VVKIINHPAEYYIDRMKTGNYFSLSSYSDAEWFCVLNHRLGCETGLGQTLDGKTGERLLDVLRRRNSDTKFLFSMPKVVFIMQDGKGVSMEKRINDLIPEQKEFFEKESIGDDLAEEGNGSLHPFIKQLQSMSVVTIGNAALKGLDFLHPKLHVSTSCPNLHMEEQGIERAAREAIDYGKSGVYLVSAGVSAPLIIDQLHDEIPDSFFIDCGSIWDAFVGIGGQREWRAELYENPERLEKWKKENVYGKSDSGN